MKEIFDDYLRISSGRTTGDAKVQAVRAQYRRYFPQDRQAAARHRVGRGEMLSCMKDWGYRHYRA